jgi:hypothetical protein
LENLSKSKGYEFLNRRRIPEVSDVPRFAGKNYRKIAESQSKTSVILREYLMMCCPLASNVNGSAENDCVNVEEVRVARHHRTYTMYKSDVDICVVAWRQSNPNG